VHLPLSDMPREARSSAPPIVDWRFGAIDGRPLIDCLFAEAAPRPPSEGRGPASEFRDAMAEAAVVDDLSMI
jgi:hypothetical protein